MQLNHARPHRDQQSTMMPQPERIWHRNTGHTARPAPSRSAEPSRLSSVVDDGGYPRFVPHSDEEVDRHTSFLRVTTFPFTTAKGAFLTNIEWCSAGGASGNGDAGGGAATPRVRMLVEREPLDVRQARDRARALAQRHSVPVVLVVAH
jgi:hypothetical protein